MTPIIALHLTRPWYGEIVPCVVAVLIIVLVCKFSKKGAPLWGEVE